MVKAFNQHENALLFRSPNQKNNATLISTETLGAVSSGQFLFMKDPWAFAKNFPFEYWWKTKTSFSLWNE